MMKECSSYYYQYVPDKSWRFGTPLPPHAFTSRSGAHLDAQGRRMFDLPVSEASLRLHSQLAALPQHQRLVPAWGGGRKDRGSSGDQVEPNNSAFLPQPLFLAPSLRGSSGRCQIGVRWGGGACCRSRSSEHSVNISIHHLKGYILKTCSAEKTAKKNFTYGMNKCQLIDSLLQFEC